MPGAHDWAVVFDVDGPLLELTAPEEDAFFVPYERLYGLTGLSRDWDSYRVRNDEEIAFEILERHLARAPTKMELDQVFDIYVEHLRSGYEAGDMAVKPIPGAVGLVAELAERPDGALGIATANILGAAQLRLAGRDAQVRQVHLRGRIGPDADHLGVEVHRPDHLVLFPDDDVHGLYRQYIVPPGRRLRLAGAPMKTETLLLGHSPDPDDAFMFYGLAADKVPTRGWRFEHVLQLLFERTSGTAGAAAMFTQRDDVQESHQRRWPRQA